MAVTNTQMFGLVTGSLPGLNFIAAPIKFVYYKSQETTLSKSARAQVSETAEEVNQVAQSRFNLNDEIPNLKWYALLQFIPLVGIYFAWKEKQLLEKINAASSNNLNAPKAKASVKNELEQEVKNDNGFITLTDANYEATVNNHDKLVVLYYKKSIPMSAMATNTFKTIEKLPNVAYAMIDLDVKPRNEFCAEISCIPLVMLYMKSADGNHINRKPSTNYKSTVSIEGFIRVNN